MKLDVNVLRYLSKEDWRTLTAVEMGQKNHELVPVQLVDSISGLKHGGAYRALKTLLQHKLVHHESQKYDGYRLTYMGYDFLAIKALVARGHISGVGRQIGVGKESDIFEVLNDEGEVFALKLHRLGRTSFRDVKSKRDYLGTRSNYSWLYLSRLAALKEYAFMKALSDHGFPVPTAIDNNRHAVLMELVDAQPLVQVRELGHPAEVYSQAMDLIQRLAACGLVHCDFNEFNLLINEEEELTLIDFPQMVSVSHANARELFERDVDCIVRFFNKKIGYMPQLDASLARVRPSFDEAAVEAAAAGAEGLDVELAASGFQRQHQKTLEEFAASLGAHNQDSNAAEVDEDDEQDTEGTEGSTDEQASEGDSDASCTEQGVVAGEEQAGEDTAAAAQLSDRLASAACCSSRPASAAGSSRQHRVVSASMQQWLDDHVGQGDAATTAAAAAATAAAATAAVNGSSSEQQGGPAGGPSTDDADNAGLSGSEGGSCSQEEDIAAVRHQQPGREWEQGSVAPSRAPTDISFMSREVQQRLVAQRQKASAQARTAKASRNVSKARGKKAKATAAALSEW